MPLWMRQPTAQHPLGLFILPLGGKGQKRSHRPPTPLMRDYMISKTEKMTASILFGMSYVRRTDRERTESPFSSVCRWIVLSIFISRLHHGCCQHTSFPIVNRPKNLRARRETSRESLRESMNRLWGRLSFETARGFLRYARITRVKYEGRQYHSSNRSSAGTTGICSHTHQATPRALVDGVGMRLDVTLECEKAARPERGCA